MRTANLAVMFADLVGYTRRTSEQSYEQNAAMVQRFSHVVNDISKSFRGRVVKEMGDGALVVFPSPTRAVQAAMAIHDCAVESNRDCEDDEHFQLRIGINVGEVRLERGDVYGDAVNVAARVEAETPVGSIYISGATYMTMNRSGFSFEPMGVRELKGVDVPVSLYAVTGVPEEAVSDLERRNEDETLPFRGRQLSRLRTHRRRAQHRMRLAIATACALCPMGVYYGWGSVSEYKLEQEVQELVVTARLRQAADLLSGMQPSEEYRRLADLLLAAVARSEDAASACAILDTLEDTGLGSETTMSALRVSHGAKLIFAGELAQAKMCLPYQLDPATPEGRDLTLIKIHLSAAEALGIRSLKDLREVLQAYKAYLQEGGAAREHLEYIAKIAAAAYENASSRSVADPLIAEFLREVATPALAQVAVDPNTTSGARNWIIARLEDVGKGIPVDWLTTYATHLEDHSCVSRRQAIAGLRRLGQLTAVGLLQREVARADRCTSFVAAEAANYLIARGRMPSPHEPALVATVSRD